MPKIPLVSILTPTYNHEKYIVDCIESVIKQTFENWEMIVLNDGSTDSTLNLVAEYAARDERILLVDQENIGIFRLSEIYNRGLQLARGEYVAILEGDDCWSADKLEKQMDALSLNPNAVLCWGQARCVNEDISRTYYIAPDLKSSDAKFFHNDPVGSILNVFLFRNCIPALTMVIRKDVLTSIGGFKQVFNLPLVDFPTLYELADEGVFHFIPEILGDWRNYSSQVTKTYPAEMMTGFYQLAKACLSTHSKSTFANVDMKILDHYYQKRMVIAYARSGRYKLIRNEFSAARTDYRKALFGFGLLEPVWKLRAIIGLILSFFHLNVEGLARFLNKRSYT